MSDTSPVIASTETLARWEERSAQRVLETGRDQILERSRKIVDAAYNLLREGGLDGLTIRAVLNKTGLSRRAFYERFEGKDDLVVAAFEQTIRLAVQYFTELITPLSDPMERLRVIVTCMVLGDSLLPGEDGQHNSRLSVALSREHMRLAESRPYDLQIVLSPLIALMAQQLKDGMAAGVVREGDPQRLAGFVYNLVSTTMHTEYLASELSQPMQEERIRLAEDIWEFCRRAIAA